MQGELKAPKYFLKCFKQQGCSYWSRWKMVKPLEITWNDDGSGNPFPVGRQLSSFKPALSSVGAFATLLSGVASWLCPTCIRSTVPLAVLFSLPDTLSPQMSVLVTSEKKKTTKTSVLLTSVFLWAFLQASPNHFLGWIDGDDIVMKCSRFSCLCCTCVTMSCSQPAFFLP